jgi:hypothetical protein
MSSAVPRISSPPTPPLRFTEAIIKEGIKGNCDNAKIPGFSNTHYHHTTTLILHLITLLQFD